MLRKIRYVALAAGSSLLLTVPGFATGAFASNAASTTVPAAPTSVVAKAGNGGVVLSWYRQSDGGSTITRYVIIPHTAGRVLAAVTAGGNPSSYTVWGLTNGTSYTFTVAAANATGIGPASSPSAAVVPSALPGVPSSVTAVAGNSSATVTWRAPSSNGSAIVAYRVTPWVQSTAQTPVMFSSAATTEKVTGLTNGTGYSFAVTALNANGASQPSTASVPGRSLDRPGCSERRSGYGGQHRGRAGVGPAVGWREERHGLHDHPARGGPRSRRPARKR